MQVVQPAAHRTCAFRDSGEWGPTYKQMTMSYHNNKRLDVEGGHIVGKKFFREGRGSEKGMQG